MNSRIRILAHGEDPSSSGGSSQGKELKICAEDLVCGLGNEEATVMVRHTQDTKQPVEIGDERQENRWREMWRKQERRKMEKEMRRRNSRREERKGTDKAGEAGSGARFGVDIIETKKERERRKSRIGGKEEEIYGVCEESGDG